MKNKPDFPCHWYNQDASDVNRNAKSHSVKHWISFVYAYHRKWIMPYRFTANYIGNTYREELLHKDWITDAFNYLNVLNRMGVITWWILVWSVCNIILCMPNQIIDWVHIITTNQSNWTFMTDPERSVVHLQSWWRNQMETFFALLAICAGNSPVPGEFPAQMPVTRSFGVFFDLRLSKCWSKQSWGWWFETPSRPLWRQCNGIIE